MPFILDVNEHHGPRGATPISAAVAVRLTRPMRSLAMIVLRTRPIQKSCANGARGDVVGVRAATDRHGGVCETLSVQPIERSCRIYGSRVAALGAGFPIPSVASEVQFEGFFRREFRSADLLQLADAKRS